jgi:hypothetical protein
MVRGISVNFLEQHFCSQQNHISREVQFVSNILLPITARGLCCIIIVLNMHTPTEVKSEDINNNYTKLEQAFKATSTSAWCLALRFSLLVRSSKNIKSP